MNRPNKTALTYLLAFLLCTGLLLGCTEPVPEPAAQPREVPGQQAEPATPGTPAPQDGQESADETPEAGAEAEKEEAPAEPDTVMVAMSDGTQLATDIYLPLGEGPFPVILARTVYGRPGGAAFAPLFNGMNVAFVIQDTRGRGDSEGKDMVFQDDGWGEHQDGADTVAWMLEQDWCNGDVGTFGMSALGITQVLMAPATPSIQAQAIWVAASDFYGQLSYQGGVWRKNLCERWVKGQKSTHVLPIWKSHPCDDAFWAQFDADARAADVTAPGIHVGGWWDIFAQGTLNAFTYRHNQGGAATDDAPGARGNQLLIMGPWAHGGPFAGTNLGGLALAANQNFDVNGYTLRFLAHWLKGDDNGIADEPPVHYYTLGDAGDEDAPGNEWRTADNWPPFETVEKAMYLTADGGLSETALSGGADPLTFKYDPADPCPTLGGQNLILPAGPFDQKPLLERTDVLAFMTEPLDEPLEVTGRVKVRLHVSTDVADTDFTAKLVDVYPDGRHILLLDNIQRLKFRNGFDRPDPLPAGEIGQLEIDLWSTSIIFNEGHRIGLHISSSNYPRFERNPNNGKDLPPDIIPEEPEPKPEQASGAQEDESEQAESDPDENAEEEKPAIPEFDIPETSEPLPIATNRIHVDNAHPSVLLLPVPAS